jgi:hypothetical protein
MKYTYHALGLLMFIGQAAIAQSPKEITVKAGQSVVKTLPASERYVLPSFEYGNIFFRDGKKLGASASSLKIRMNYDMLAQTLSYIDPKGDTANFVLKSPVLFAKIGSETFLSDYSNGYLQVIDSSGAVKLAEQKKWSFIRHENAGADGYGGVSQAASKFNSARVNYSQNNLVNENTVFRLRKIFYLIDSRNRIYEASSGGFQKAFPAIKDQIRDYVAKEKYRFGVSGKEETEKLLNFCRVQSGGI